MGRRFQINCSKTGLAGGMFLEKNSSHSKNRSALIQPFGESLIKLFGREPELSCGIFRTPLKIDIGGRKHPEALMAVSTVVVVPFSAYVRL